MDEEHTNPRQGQTTEPSRTTDAKADARSRAPAPTAKAEHRWKRRARLKVLLLVLLPLAAIGALVWFLSVRYWTTPVTPIANQPTAEPLPSPNFNTNVTANTPAPASPSPLETPSASPAASPGVEPAPQEGSAQPGVVWPTPSASAPPAVSDASTPQPTLLVPVAGVRLEDLRDTYTQSRSEGRVHNAIDIMAPRGTPVVAAADGKIVKLFNSVQGGTTAYQLATDNRTVLYYAHLERYADNLAEGHFARRGEVIGYVGDTGNAGAGNYHLHFSVSITSDPTRWHGGENINPYPLLRGE